MLFKLTEIKSLKLLFKKDNFLKAIVLSILCASLISFKAYGAILVGGSLFVLGVYKLLKKDISVFVVFVLMVFLSILFLAPQFSKTLPGSIATNSIFIFSPFWFVHSMIDNPDRVGWLKLAAAREAYFQRGEWIKFVLAEGLGLSIFILGNLGLRLFGFLGLFKKGITDYKIMHFFILIFSLISFTIPLFFIQAGNPWNVIQFFYYGLFTTALFTGSILSSLVKKLPLFAGVPVLVLVLLIAPVSSFTTARGYTLERPHAFISQSEVEGLKFLASQPDGVVLTYPFSKGLRSTMGEPFPLYVYDTTAYVSAFSKKAVFVEDEIQNEILQTDFIKRLLISREIFNKKDFAKSNLEKNGIQYIYVQKAYNKNLNEHEMGIKKIFENSEVIIYKVKNENEKS